MVSKPPPERERKDPDAKPRTRADQERLDRDRAEPEFERRERQEPASPTRAKTEPDSPRREPAAPSLRGDRPQAAPDSPAPRERQEPASPTRAKTEPEPPRREPAVPSLRSDRPRGAADSEAPRERQEPALPIRPRADATSQVPRDRQEPALPARPRAEAESQPREPANPPAASRGPAPGPASGRAAAAAPAKGGELVLIEIADGTESHVAILTLNAAKIRNALTAEMRTALRDALKILAADDTVHALIVTGAEGNFCAGGDVRTMGETDPDKIRARMTEVAETAQAVAAFPKPVIAAVAGHAAGAGVSLACLADIVVAEEDAQFTFSFLRLALGPDWGLSWSLPRRVGATQARGLILARGAIDADEAQHIGLVDHIAEDSALDAAVALAKEMCNGPREAIASVKTMLSDLAGLRDALDAEMQMQLLRFPAPEHQEGAAAFREKRAPDYTKKR
jgi:2-(1,2-epoxy-1,2-dihydrophenyl)acetyl-CoA isomerase